MSEPGDNHESQQDVVTIARGGSIAFVGRFFSLALNYVLAMIMARGLGASEYGLFVVGLSLVNLLGSLSLLGLNRGTVRFIAIFRGTGDRSRELGVYKTSVRLVLASGIAIALLLVALADPLGNLLNIPSETGAYFWGFALWIPIWALTFELAAVAEALKRLEYRTAIVDIAWPVARVLLTAGVLILGGRLASVVWANLVASVLALLLAAASVHRLFLRGLEGVRAISDPRQLLAFSLPVMLFNLLALSQNQVDVYLLAALESSASTGLFNVAARTTILIVAFLEGIGIVFSPFVAELSSQNRMTDLKRLVSTVTHWSFMIGLPVAIAIILFHRPILLLFGDAFLAAAPALIVLSIAQLINAATGPVGIVLTMSGHPNLNLLDSILTLVLNVVLNVLLIPRLGILGAAIGSTVAICSVNVLRSLQVSLILRAWIYNRQFLKPIVAVGVAGGITYWAINARSLGSEWLTFGVGLLAFSLIYVAGILFLGLSESDLLVLRTLRNRMSRELARY